MIPSTRSSGAFTAALNVTIVVLSLGVVGLVIRRELMTQEKPSNSAAEPPSRPVSDWKRIAAIGHASGGDTSATLSVVVFSDYQCPSCARLHWVLERFTAQYPGDVRVVMRHLPLRSIHPHAAAAAEAAECAAAQGQFAGFSSAAYTGQAAIGSQSWTIFAIAAGVRDTTAFASCVDHRTYRAAVERDETVAQELGLRGTPAVIVNGQLYSGAPPISFFEGQLRKARGTRLR